MSSDLVPTRQLERFKAELARLVGLIQGAEMELAHSAVECPRLLAADLCGVRRQLHATAARGDLPLAKLRDIESLWRRYEQLMLSLLRATASALALELQRQL